MHIDAIFSAIGRWAVRLRWLVVLVWVVGAIAAVSQLPGLSLGLWAAYRGGRVESFIMRLVDIQLSFPPVLIALILLALTGPGLGKIIVGALNQRDYTMLQGLMVIYCFLIVVVNLITDLTYGIIDPRVKQ